MSSSSVLMIIAILMSTLAISLVIIAIGWFVSDLMAVWRRWRKS